MKRLLFVDDDARVLSGIADDLALPELEWQVELAATPEEALERLDDEDYDAIVTELGMPLTLLTEARERHPTVARVIVGERPAGAKALDALAIAHQFVSKPLSVTELAALIDRTMAIHRLVTDPKVHAAAGELDHLPPRPETYAAVTRMLNDPNVSLKAVAARIGEDLAIATQLIKVVNTPFFYRGERIRTVLAAVQRLGPARVRDLVLTLELERIPATKCGAFSMAEASSHGLAVANLARQLAPGIADEEDAFLAGLLHDVGETVAALQLPVRFGRALTARRTRRLPDNTVERAHLGATHGELGALLLALWGFDYDLIAAVAHHHEPWITAGPKVGLTDLLCACELLVEGIDESSATHRQGLAWLRERGLYDRVMGPWSQALREQGARLAV